MYSGTSDNRHSEEQTTSIEQTNQYAAQLISYIMLIYNVHVCTIDLQDIETSLICTMDKECAIKQITSESRGGRNCRRDNSHGLISTVYYPVAPLVLHLVDFAPY